MRKFTLRGGMLWLLTMFSIGVFAQLNGVYTIDAGLATGGTNYASFTDAVTALTTNGVSGAVTFNVKSGTYTEQIALPAITGTSASNTVTFQSDPTNLTTPSLTFTATSSTTNYVVRFSGASFVTLKDLAISNGAVATYGRVIDFSTAASNNTTIQGCTISSGAITAGTAYAAIYASVTYAINNLTITGNTFPSTGYTIYISGSTTNRSANLTVTNNTANMAGYFLYTSGVESATVTGNTITGDANSSTQYGVYMTNSSTAANAGVAAVVERNNMVFNTTSTVYGVYMGYFNANGLSPMRIVNNMIVCGPSGTGATYGIYPFHVNNLQIYHNSVLVRAGSLTSGRAAYFNKSTSGTAFATGGVDVRNNIFSNTGGGYAIEVSSAAATGFFSMLNYNLYYGTGATPLYWSGTGQATLAGWQGASLMDANSLYGDPLFASATDLHGQGTLANNAADASAGVTVDIDGDTRSLSTPDMGADEYAPATCFPVSAISSSNVTGTTASIGWTSNSATVIASQIEYGVSGTALGSGTRMTNAGNGTTVALMGLSGYTTYGVYVREICAVGDTGSWSGPSTFTTAIVPAWLDGFTSYPPAGWSEAQGNISNPTTLIGTSSSWSADGWLNSGSTGAAKLNIYGTTVDEWMFTPSIDLSAGGPYQLEFDIALMNWNGTNATTFDADDSLIVVISTDNGATWSRSNTIAMFHAANAPSNIGQHEVISLAAYSGMVKIGFYGESTVSGADNDLMIDNIEVKTIPSCQSPLSLASYAITSTGFGFTFDGSAASSYTLEYGATGFTLGTGTQVALTNDSTTISGLSSNTAYDVYVRNNCGPGNQSAFSGPLTVTTLCAAYAAPFLETFTATSLPTCWAQSATTGGPWVFSWVSNPDFGTNVNMPDHTSGTTGSGATWVDQSSTDVGVVLQMPDVDVAALTNPQMSFWVVSHNNSGSVTTFNPLYVERWDGTNWVVISTTQGNFGLNWHNVTVPLAGTAYSGTLVRLRFRMESGGDPSDFDNDVMLDDVEVRETPTCPAPTTIGLVSMAPGTLTFAVGGATVSNFNVEYGTTGFTPGAGTSTTATNDTITLSGLTNLQSYDIYVQANCGGGDLSTWTGPVSFYLGYCSPAPSSVDGQGITNITMGTINNTTGTETNNYGDYSAQSTDVAQTTTVNVDITYSTGYTYDTKIWVDWNDDFDFNDAGEEVYTGVSTSANPTTLAASFLVPANAPLGQHRIRIGGVDSGPPTACYTGSWGSFEDYTINVTPPPACSVPSGAMATAMGTDSIYVQWTTTAYSTTVEYGPAGFTPGTGMSMTVQVDSLFLTGLTAGTAYDIYLQDSCATGTLSTVVGPISASTAVCAASAACAFTFAMGDTYGDGWNGGAVTIYQNGISAGVLTYPCGGFSGCSLDSMSLNICDLSSVTAVLTTGGGYPEEIELTVYDPYGITVGTYVANFSAAQGDTLVTFNASCAAPTNCPIADMPMVADQTSCGPTAVTFNASMPTNPNYGVVWFNSDTAALATGMSYTTGAVTSNQTYYAAYGSLNGPAQHVGPLTNISTSGFGNFTNGQWFSAYDYFSLDSVVVRSNGNTVNGFVQISTAGATGAGTLIAAAPFSVTGAGDHQIYVGLPIAPGQYYININFVAGTTGQLFRSTAGAVYPYTIANVVSIDSTNFGTPGVADVRYYYTFDWTVTPACVGPLVAANAIAGSIPSTALPYSEDFDGGLPCNWSVVDSAGGAIWQNVASYNGSGIDSNFMFIDDDAVGSSVTSEAYLYSPVFTAIGYDTLKVSFDQYYRSLTGQTGEVDVFDGTNWVNLATYTSTQGSWTTPLATEFDVTMYQNASLQFRFHFDDGGQYGWYWAVDNFELEGIQTPCQNVVVSVTTDIYGSEVSWSIEDSISGLVYATGGPFPDVSPYNAAAATHIDTVCLPVNGTFVFRIEDSYGDGLFDGTNNGTYDLSVLCPAGPLSKLSGTGALPFDPGGATAFVPSYDSVVFDLDCTPPTPMYNVTLQVDMNQQTVTGLGVHVAGNFQDEAGFPADWDPSSTALTDPDADGVYTVTVSIPAGTYEYKYVNGNAWGNDESVPAACAVNGNRGMTISGDTTISAVCYAACGPCTTPPVLVNLTLQVNMANETVSANGVHVAGTFNGFSPSATQMTDPDADGIYTVTVQVPENDTVLYTFINGNDWPGQEASAGLASCGLPNGFGGFNRYSVVGTTAVTAPVVCFESCADCGIGLEEINGGYVDFSIFPNPSNGMVTIQNVGNGTNGAQVEIMSLDGKVVYSAELKLDSSKQQRLDLSAYSKGLYIVRITSDARVEVHHLAIQ